MSPLGEALERAGEALFAGTEAAKEAEGELDELKAPRDPAP